MHDILYDLSPKGLLHAIEENLFAWVPELGKMGRHSSNEPPGVSRSIVDIPNALFNSVMETSLDVDNIEATIQFIQSDARKRKVPILWWMTPSTMPSNLDQYLERCGFKIDDDGPGMAVELDKLVVDLPRHAGLEIEPVHDDVSLWEWCSTMQKGFEIPASASHVVVAWHDFLNRVTSECMQAYLARLDGEPVATSLLFTGGGVAGIYAVSTIPERRRKGIGAQVTLLPLLDARQRGYKAGILQASEMGEGVYRSLGFKEYCRINSYRFQP